MKKDGEKNYRKMLLTAVSLTVIACVLTGTATFAWFSNNSVVGTTTVSGKSGISDMKLLIGSDDTNLQDTSTDEFEIPQVNETNPEKLYPVSTSDLETFHYACTYDNEGNAVGFAKDENETRLVHGRLYFRLDGENMQEDMTYKLYLDKSSEFGGDFGESTEGNLLNAARLGLKVEDQEAVILYFPETTSGIKKNNTVIGGTVIGNGYVLDANGSQVQDPAEDPEVYTMDSSQLSFEIPEKPIGEYKINQTYAMDVFFYLEGCDEDCNEAVANNNCEIHLAFYAITD